MGIWRFAKFLRNARTLCMHWQPIVHSQSPALSRSGMSPARADDPDRPRLLHDDPIALSISGPHPVAARLVVGPDDASSRLHSKEQPFTCPLTSYMPAVSRYFGFVCRRLGTGVGAAIGVSLSLRLCCIKAGLPA